MNSRSSPCADDSKPDVNRRLCWLVAAHMLLAAAPLLGLLLPLFHFLPALWAIQSVPVGSLVTLSVWVGLGAPRMVWRLFAALAAIAYVAIWPIVAPISQMWKDATIDDRIEAYPSTLVPYILLVVVIGGMFMALRGRYAIARVPERDEGSGDDRFQFSVLSLLIVMTLAAIVVEFVRAARGDREFGGGSGTALAVFVALVFMANTACAVQSTLQTGRFLRDVLLSLLLSVLLGIAVTLAMGHDVYNWWHIAGATLITVIPNAIVIVSLLVVRSCGFRLVRKQSEPVSLAD